MQVTYHFYDPITERWQRITGGVFGETLMDLAAMARAGNDLVKFRGFAFQAVVGDEPADGSARLSAFDADHVGEILADRERGNYSNFSAHVIRLLKKADAHQRERLRMIYPDHVAAVERWERQPLTNDNGQMTQTGGRP
jgi:hypothetical protein